MKCAESNRGNALQIQVRPHGYHSTASPGRKEHFTARFNGSHAVCALYAKAPMVHLPCLVRMLAAPLHFTRPFHHIHPPLPLRFHMLRSIQGREFATWGDRLCVRYARSGCVCAMFNRSMPDVLAPFHSYTTIDAPARPSRASTGPFAPSKKHLIAYVAARDCTRIPSHGRSPTDEFLEPRSS